MRCLYFYLIGFLLLLFVSCECQQTKEASSICHFVEEYRNMYYNELSPTDSMFFAALIEENDGVSSLFLIGTKDVIPSFVQRPPLPVSIGEFCELIDPIDSVESSGIPKDISVNSDSTTNLTDLEYFSHGNNWIFVYSLCNCNKCLSILKGISLNDSKNLDETLKKHLDFEGCINPKEWFFSYDENAHLQLYKVR